MIGPRCDCPHDGAPAPQPSSIVRDAIVAAIGGAVAAIVSEVGQGVREWLSRRAANNTSKGTNE